MNLTEKRIDGLTVEDGRRDRLVFDEEQRGLAVRVVATGGRSYLVQYTMHGVKYRVPLGSCDALPLAKARKAAAVIMGEVAKGKNPALERKEEARKAKLARERLTVGELIDTWERLHLQASRRARYAAEAPRALRNALAKHLDKPADELDRRALVRILDGIQKSSPAMASRTQAYGAAAFAWSLKRGAVQNNPFASLPTMASSPKRARILSDDEIKAVWDASGSAVKPYSEMVRLLLLTGQRREEVAGMTWGELSPDLTTWTIPRERAKNGVAHVVPLAKSVSKIIRATLPDEAHEDEIACLRAKNTLVFPGKAGTPYGGWAKSKTQLDGASGVNEWVLHDLRRTLATGLQRLGVRLEVTEAVLNHISGSRGGIVGIYQRHDWAIEKRAALNAWSEQVLGFIAMRKTTGDNVTRLRAQA